MTGKSWTGKLPVFEKHPDADKGDHPDLDKPPYLSKDPGGNFDLHPDWIFQDERYPNMVLFRDNRFPDRAFVFASEPPPETRTPWFTPNDFPASVCRADGSADQPATLASDAYTRASRDKIIDWAKVPYSLQKKVEDEVSPLHCTPNEDERPGFADPKAREQQDQPRPHEAPESKAHSVPVDAAKGPFGEEATSNTAKRTLGDRLSELFERVMPLKNVRQSDEEYESPVGERGPNEYQIMDEVVGKGAEALSEQEVHKASQLRNEMTVEQTAQSLDDEVVEAPDEQLVLGKVTENKEGIDSEDPTSMLQCANNPKEILSDARECSLSSLVTTDQAGLFAQESLTFLHMSTEGTLYEDRTEADGALKKAPIQDNVENEVATLPIQHKEGSSAEDLRLEYYAAWLETRRQQDEKFERLKINMSPEDTSMDELDGLIEGLGDVASNGRAKIHWQEGQLSGDQTERSSDESFSVVTSNQEAVCTSAPSLTNDFTIGSRPRLPDCETWFQGLLGTVIVCYFFFPSRLPRWVKKTFGGMISPYQRRQWWWCRLAVGLIVLWRLQWGIPDDMFMTICDIPNPVHWPEIWYCPDSAWPIFHCPTLDRSCERRW